MNGTVRRFACTQCGACCNRSPEVELSEAAGLADLFVFRLMFRLYQLQGVFDGTRSNTSETFYEKKRLLSAHAARQYSTKVVQAGKRIELLNYLMISALAVDSTLGTCAALHNKRCSIHERRPLTCRTVPLHYSRAQSLAERDFDAFVGMPGHRCDISGNAALILVDGRIVDTETLRAREEAAALARCDRPWKKAIVRGMKAGGGSSTSSLPSLAEVEANAALAAVTTSMRAGWHVAATAGIIAQPAYSALVGTQLATIERELARGLSSATERETLEEMRSEYRQVLGLT